MLPVLRILLGPLLLLQGRGVRKKILRMPEPDGERAGTTGEGPSLRLLILGDSSAAGVGADHQDAALSGQILRRLGKLRSVDFRILATTGWTTEDAVDALPQLESEIYDAAVICLGVNDITTETGRKAWLRLYARLLQQLSDRHGVQLAVLVGMPPMGRFPALPQPLRWYLGLQATAHDQALGELAEKQAVAVHLPIRSALPPSAAAEDGFHPGPLVYDELGEVISETILSNLSKDGAD
ncbi:MAG: SGNH/GDSL hydrolase family protein [Pseudomonadota bacterium]